MNLELRHLKVVCAIAETGSVTKAASLLGLAQPALTAQLQRIERTLGGPLFERDRRGARPTALGELVLARARVLLPAMKGLQDEAARLAGAGSGDAGTGSARSNGPILGGLVHRLAADQPEAQISTYASWSSTSWPDGAGRPARLRARRRLRRRHPVGRVRPDLAGDRGGRRLRAAARRRIRWPRSDEVRPGRAGRGAVGGGARRRLLRRLLRRRLRAGRLHPAQDATRRTSAAASTWSRPGRRSALCQADLPAGGRAGHPPLAGAPLRWRQLLGWHPDSPRHWPATPCCGTPPRRTRTRSGGHRRTWPGCGTTRTSAARSRPTI